MPNKCRIYSTWEASVSSNHMEPGQSKPPIWLKNIKRIKWKLFRHPQLSCSLCAYLWWCQRMCDTKSEIVAVLTSPLSCFFGKEIISNICADVDKTSFIRGVVFVADSQKLPIKYITNKPSNLAPDVWKPRLTTQGTYMSQLRTDAHHRWAKDNGRYCFLPWKWCLGWPS